MTIRYDTIRYDILSVTIRYDTIRYSISDDTILSVMNDRPLRLSVKSNYVSRGIYELHIEIA